MKDIYTKLSKTRIKYASPDAYFKEAFRYFENAKLRLRESPIQHNRYQDIKPVREACGTCYVAVLLAIDGYLLQRGVNENNLPSSTKEYWLALEKYIPHNGKLSDAFSIVYENLHRFGYYLGGSNVEMVKASFKNAARVIDMLPKSTSKKLLI